MAYNPTQVLQTKKKSDLTDPLNVHVTCVFKNSTKSRACPKFSAKSWQECRFFPNLPFSQHIFFSKKKSSKNLSVIMEKKSCFFFLQSLVFDKILLKDRWNVFLSKQVYCVTVRNSTSFYGKSIFQVILLTKFFKSWIKPKWSIFICLIIMRGTVLVLHHTLHFHTYFSWKWSSFVIIESMKIRQ